MTGKIRTAGNPINPTIQPWSKKEERNKRRMKQNKGDNQRNEISVLRVHEMPRKSGFYVRFKHSSTLNRTNAKIVPFL